MGVTHSASPPPRLRPGEAWVVTTEASVSAQRLPRTTTRGDQMPRRKGSGGGSGGCEQRHTGPGLWDHKYSRRRESAECEVGKGGKLLTLLWRKITGKSPGYPENIKGKKWNNSYLLLRSKYDKETNLTIHHLKMTNIFLCNCIHSNNSTTKTLLYLKSNSKSNWVSGESGCIT